MLAEMIRAARGAGEMILAAKGRGDVTKKGEQNYVTDCDLRVQEYIFTVLSRAFPDADFAGEEQEDAGVPEHGPCFVVDPIDATTNFMHDMRLSAVSIALCESRRPVAAVILNPYSGELFTAERGGGAYCNGAAIHSSGRALCDALVGVGTSPYDRTKAGATLAIAAELMRICRDIRRSGCAAYDLACVAAGRLDAFYELTLSPWDYAAGALIIEEAGGRAEGLDGPLPYYKPSPVLAANSICMDRLRDIVAGGPAL